ncbi:ATP synthase F1 subunit delta [Apilactobacillus ozensis]|uniref:ATP synthase F1 subunit delta n=1 Tax=Apilactobacillus ozensis TaxID=866801 RepID=UPI00200A758E|nr:ATP synthase F1 subunit delta [Apilactobacillus ozensis]MCK8606962.1 F0F1 ATP synthase subunit delta [Apilactobacillus ozensis]
MLDKITFANRYSKALFEVLKADGQLDSGYAELKQIEQIFNDNANLSQVLADVSFPESKKQELIKPLIDNADSKYIKNLLKVLVGAGRVDALQAIFEHFEALYDEENKIVHANVISAVPLTDDQKNNLSQTFAKRVNADRVIFNCKVDQSIIGGLVVKSSNVIFDGSVKTKISNIKKLLLN